MILEPSTQTKLFGHNELFLHLVNLYINNKLPNKILFSGEKGIGKSTISYHLINYILSSNEEYSYNIERFEISLENKLFLKSINRIYFLIWPDPSTIHL